MTYRRASRLESQLALAHAIDQWIDAGVISSYADVSRGLGLTRARVSQIMSLLGLSSTIQESVLLGRLRAGERAFRQVSLLPMWKDQDTSEPIEDRMVF